MTRREDWLGSVTGDVAYDPAISPAAKAVYLVLAMTRNTKDDTCFPSNATIAGYTGLSVRTCIRAMNELVAHGVVKRIPRFVEGRQTTSINLLADVQAHRGGHQPDTGG